MSHVSADSSLTTYALIVDAAKSKVRIAAIEYYMALSAAAALPGIGVGASLRPEVLAKADELFAAARALVEAEDKAAAAKVADELARLRVTCVAGGRAECLCSSCYARRKREGSL